MFQLDLFIYVLMASFILLFSIVGMFAGAWAFVRRRLCIPLCLVLHLGGLFDAACCILFLYGVSGLGGPAM